MTYQNEHRILKMRLAREQGRLATTFDAAYPQANVTPVQPSQYSEVEEFMARHYEDEALLSSGLIPGIIHNRRGVWEGLDARNVAQRTAQIDYTVQTDLTVETLLSVKASQITHLVRMTMFEYSIKILCCLANTTQDRFL